MQQIKYFQPGWKLGQLADPRKRDEHVLLHHEHVHLAKQLQAHPPPRRWNSPERQRLCKNHSMGVKLLQVEYKSYYQWVPFVLFFQACLFYAPHVLFKLAEEGKVKY